MYQDARPTLKTLLGEYPKTAAIRDGSLDLKSAHIEVADYTEATKGFKAMVRDLAFDVAEVAIITFLQAREHGKPYVLLPFVMNGKFHHASCIYNNTKGPMVPADLNGKRVGLRSYTQTTPTWVRGILSENGVDISSLTFVTFEDAHVAEYVEPANVVRAPAGAKLQQMLLDGEIDAALTSLADPDPRLSTLIPNPQEAALAWHAEHQAVPINHMVSVRKELVEERPEIVRELFDLLIESRERGGGSTIKNGIDLQPVGLENVRNALALAIQYALDQKLISKPVTVDELFGPVTSALGAK
jgi:4,5-dihydroxyphthalate decarboxylase